MKKKFNMGVLAVAIAILLSIFLVNAKKGYHIDEIYTYVLSNRVLLPGEHYSSINKNEILNGDYFMQWITAEGESRFNIRNVVYTMTTDNHPPFYFIVFNGVSSLIPGVFTKWTGATVNLIFFILTCFAIKKLAALLCADKYFSTAVCSIYALSPAVIAQNTFYRMYVTLAFWVVLITYLILYYDNKKWDLKFCTGLFMLSVCGTLTQYYFLIYIFFLILFAGIGKLFEKQIADCLKLAGTMSLAGIVCVTLYPSILQHLFSSSRGKEAFSNLSETSFPERIKAFGTFINNQIYGSLGIVFLLTVLLYTAIVWKSGRRLSSDRNSVIVVLSTLLYMIIISKIAPYITNRYIFPVYPLVILFNVLLLWKMVAFINTWVTRYLVFVVFFGGFAAGSLYNKTLGDFLFKEAEAKQYCIETNNIQNALFVSENEWKIFFDIPEILNQDKILLADSDTCTGVDALSLFNGKNTMIFIENSIDEDEIIDKIKNNIKSEYNMVFCMGDNYFSLYSCTVK